MNVLIKNLVWHFLLVTVLCASLAATAGEQTSYPVQITEVNYRLQNPSSSVSAVTLILDGTVKEDISVHKTVNTFYPQGRITNAFQCEAYLCSASLKIGANRELIALIKKDQDQDGNIDANTEVKVGTALDNGQVQLNDNITLEFNLVEDRYTLLEKVLSEVKDKDYYSLKMRFE